MDVVALSTKTFACLPGDGGCILGFKSRPALCGDSRSSLMLSADRCLCRSCMDLPYGECGWCAETRVY